MPVDNNASDIINRSNIIYAMALELACAKYPGECHAEAATEAIQYMIGAMGYMAQLNVKPASVLRYLAGKFIEQANELELEQDRNEPVKDLDPGVQQTITELFRRKA